MGKMDTVAKEYMSNPVHFADAFNYLFDGTQVISSECLQEKDTTELGIFYDNGQEETTQKIRDVLRQCIIMEDETSTYLILGVENQSFVHYAMPAKNMVYDASIINGRLLKRQSGTDNSRI